MHPVQRKEIIHSECDLRPPAEFQLAKAYKNIYMWLECKGFREKSDGFIRHFTFLTYISKSLITARFFVKMSTLFQEESVKTVSDSQRIYSPMKTPLWLTQIIRKSIGRYIIQRKGFTNVEVGLLSEISVCLMPNFKSCVTD